MRKSPKQKEEKGLNRDQKISVAELTTDFVFD